MVTAISRYGARCVPDTERIIGECRRRGELVRGPHLSEFEERFASYLGAGGAVATSYGRMAFFYLLRALQLPRGGEIIIPALTFWVIPELARVAGLKPVFADIDPSTFTLDPGSFERAITGKTCAVVPTHLYGLPCEMDRILTIAENYQIAVIEDCAHALGSKYRGHDVGTFGDASFFSFQTLKPLNTYGGGMAMARTRKAAKRLTEIVDAVPWPDEGDVLRQLRIGRLQRFFMRPRVFTLTAFPILWGASFFGANPNVYLWEPIRPLDSMPASYNRRYSNVQAALGLAGLDWLDQWSARTRSHAQVVDQFLQSIPGVYLPSAPPDCVHAYYQYCVYSANRDQIVRDCIRHGIDIETLHVDVCTRLPLFREFQTEAPCADRAAQAVQIPVYTTLTEREIRRVAAVVRRVFLQQRGSRIMASVASRI